MTFWVAGAAVVGGALSANAASKASKAQVSSADAATAEQQRQYDLTRADQLAQLERTRAEQAPWLGTGTGAIHQLNALMGLVPGLQSQYTEIDDQMPRFTLADFQQDPGYQFRLQQGEQGINRAAASRGGFNSGATLKALARFNQDLGTQEYGNAYKRFVDDRTDEFNRKNTTRTNYFNRLASLAGVGQTAANTVGQAGQNAYSTIANAGQTASNNISNNLMGAGNARASGYVGGANALTGAIGQGINYHQQNQLMNRMFPQSYGVPQQSGVTGWVSQG